MVYTACLCFGLDLAEQGMSGFRYSYTVYQAEPGLTAIWIHRLKSRASARVA